MTVKRTFLTQKYPRIDPISCPVKQANIYKIEEKKMNLQRNVLRNIIQRPNISRQELHKKNYWCRKFQNLPYRKISRSPIITKKKKKMRALMTNYN